MIVVFYYDVTQKKMQRAVQAVRSHGNVLKYAVLQHISAPKPAMLPAAFSRFMSVSSARLEDRGFETATVADVLKSKGKSADGSWLWCTTEDSVYDAVKSVCPHFPMIVLTPSESMVMHQMIRLPFGTLNFLQMTQHNVGALVVVKPGQNKSIAGIVTERGDEQISVLLASNFWPVGMMGKIQNHVPLPPFSFNWHPWPKFFCS